MSETYSVYMECITPNLAIVLDEETPTSCTIGIAFYILVDI